ncbi:centrosomal protein of 63 kDa-like [Liolophura sinensis]|uniref:centrosomal protein of 63 kDa-like n=1 Tax=Liolophura sinensis TaxID=3198878 RepID=UPI003158D3BB
MQSPKRSHSIERVSCLWEELQSSDRLPKGTLTTACEVELQELMRQIDIMVNTRKLEWERELKAVTSQLEVRDREVNKQRKMLEQKQREVVELREKLEELTHAQEELVAQYEGQITLLRKEVQKIKRDYDRLQKKQQKSSKDAEREKEKVTDDHQETVHEVEKLKVKLEACQQESRDWEIQQRSYLNQIENLEAQKKAVSEKCDFLQQQSKTYQSQLDRRRQILDSSEFNLKTQITQLEGQLQRAKDTIAVQEEKIDKLKASLDEMTVTQREGTRENEKLLEDLNAANSRIRTLEDGKCKIEGDVQSQEGFIRMLEEDLSQRNQDLIRMEQTLADKDEVIRSLTEASRQEESEEVQRMKVELRNSRQETKNSRRSEKSLLETITALKAENEQLQIDFEDICKQLTNKTQQLGSLEQKEIQSLRSEIKKLKDKLALLEGSHSSEFEGMRKELSTMMSELHDRTTTVTKLTEENAGMKRQLREGTVVLDKKDAEIYVANSQLETLRKENRELRQEISHSDQSRSEISRLKRRVSEMTDTYNNNIHQLEDENKRLKDDLSQLKSEFTGALESVQGQLRLTKEQTNTSLQELKLKEHRKIKEVEKSAEKRIHRIQREMSTSVQGLEYPPSPGGSASPGACMRGSPGMSSSLRTSQRSNETDASIHEGRAQSPSNTSKTLTFTEDSSRNSPGLWDSRLSISVVSSIQDDKESRDSAYHRSEESASENGQQSDVSFSERFLAEENIRARELEKLIDSHIENLKLDTDAVIQKWVS